jgi:hypothetical protein
MLDALVSFAQPFSQRRDRARCVADMTLKQHWKTDWGRYSLLFSVPPESRESELSSSNFDLILTDDNPDIRLNPPFGPCSRCGSRPSVPTSPIAARSWSMSPLMSTRATTSNGCSERPGSAAGSWTAPSKTSPPTGPPGSWPSSRRPRHEHLLGGPQIAAHPARCPAALGSLLPFRPIALRGGRQFSRTPGRCWSRVSSPAPRHGRQSGDHSNRLGNRHA